MSEKIINGGNITWLDLVREVAPDATDDDCHTLLWSATCYPFGSPDQVRKTLAESWEGGGKTVYGAVAYAEDELERGMAEYREAQP
jgi:hypothetical protein